MQDDLRIGVRRDQLEEFIDTRISYIARLRLEATNRFLAEQNEFVVAELKLLRMEMVKIVRGETGTVDNSREVVFRNGSVL